MIYEVMIMLEISFLTIGLNEMFVPQKDVCSSERCFFLRIRDNWLFDIPFIFVFYAIVTANILNSVFITEITIYYTYPHILTIIITLFSCVFFKQ